MIRYLTLEEVLELHRLLWPSPAAGRGPATWGRSIRRSSSLRCVPFSFGRFGEIEGMRQAIPGCLLVAGFIALFGSLFCNFTTFATNDYGLIVGTGIILGIIGIGCISGAVWVRRKP
jgi:hypothetical protein